MTQRDVLLKEEVADADEFYKDILYNRDMTRYSKIRIRKKEEREDGIVFLYECFHKEILVWLKPFVSNTFYNHLLHYMNELEYDKVKKRIRFVVSDSENKIYSIQGYITIENHLLCAIRITETHFSMRWIPNFVKNRIINEIMDEIENQIHKN